MSVLSFLVSGWGLGERTTFVLSAVAFGTFYVLARAVNEAKWNALKVNDVSSSRERRKARSWLLSIAVSAVMSFLGVLYASELFSEFLSGGSNALVAYLLSDAGPAARSSAAFFAAFCVCDLTIGLIDYREHIGVDTGYIHHSVYLLLICVLLALNQAGALASFGLCEIPTFILACGSAHKPWRLDLPMGITFFLTRILYMALVGLAVAACGYVWQPIALTALIAMHVKWFIGWQRSYRKMLARREAAAGLGVVDDEGSQTSAHTGGVTGLPSPAVGTPGGDVPAGARAAHLVPHSDRPAHGASESGAAAAFVGDASPLLPRSVARNSGVAAAAAALAAGVEMLGDAARPRATSKLD